MHPPANDCQDFWTEVKERPEVTRDGNSQVVARLNTKTFDLLKHNP